MSDPFSGVPSIVKFILDVVTKVRERDIAFFDKVVQPACEMVKNLHVEYIRMMRILDKIALPDGGIDPGIRKKFVDVRCENDTQRDLFRYEIGAIIQQITDEDNRIFFMSIAMYVLSDEVSPNFGDHNVKRTLEGLLRRLEEMDSANAGRAALDTPSAELARRVSRSLTVAEIRDYQLEAIDTLRQRMRFITSRFVQIRQRYYPN